jgi:SPP1 gp7 family putative phage head morphogenesis protein
LATQARKIRLTPTRKRWAEGRGSATFEGKALAAPDAAEARFNATLQKAVRIMAERTNREIRRLYTAPSAPGVAQDASFASMADRLLRALRKRFNVLFSDLAGGLAEALAKGVDRQSAISLKGSLKELSGGVTLKTDVVGGAVADVIKASIRQNVALIKSIPEEYFLEIEGAVMRSIQSGRGMADLQPFLEKRYNITKNRAALIARDQTSKATTAINRARMQGLGVRKFKWLHSGGGKEPRSLHKNVLNGNVYSLDEPPVIDDRTGERGLPGQLINCRCRMVPVIEFKAEETTK